MATNTYDSGTIATTLAKVRLLIGDTRSSQSDWILSDEEIQIAIDDAKYDIATQPDDVYLMAIDCIDFILARVARNVDRNAMGMSANRSQVTQHYRDLRTTLKDKYEAWHGVIRTGATPTFTGDSIAELNELAADTDFIDRSTAWDNVSS